MQTTLQSDVSNVAVFTEAELLIECLRGSPVAASRDIHWPTFQTLSETHSVLPLAHRALAASGAEFPKSFLHAVLASRASMERLAAELELLLAGFARQSIEVIPLKGPVLAEALYGEVTMRPCTDLDLLVRANDFSRAENLLIHAGWTAASPADDYHRKFVRDGILVELHFRFMSPRSFPLDMSGAWSRAVSGVFRGHPLKQLAATDRCLHTLLHGLKHGYGKLIWILDAALALKAIQECGAQELVERARAQGLEQAFYLGCAMVLEVFPQYLSESMTAVLEESPEAMQAAHASVHKLLTGEASSGRDPRIWSFYLQTETSRVKRWRRRLTFFIPTSGDYAWAMTHRIPRRFVPFLRPFRLLGKYGFLRAWRTVFPGYS